MEEARKTPIKVMTGDKDCSVKELKAFKRGYTESSITTLKMLSESLQLLQQNRDKVTEREYNFAVNVIADFVANTTRITEGVRSNVDSNIEMANDFENLEKSEETVRH